jgi:threonine dehydrogenase-like Zn-dependent dehydrogenase
VFQLVAAGQAAAGQAGVAVVVSPARQSEARDVSIPSESAVVMFTEKEQAELRSEPMRQPGRGEILVRTTWTLISTGTESTLYGRRFEDASRWKVEYPSPAGYSHVGVVDAVGPDVRLWKVGDRVVSANNHRQYLVVPENDPGSGFRPIAANVSDRDAAWAILGRIVQMGVRRANHSLGESIVVIGLGPLGQLAVQYARLTGPRVLIAVDPVQARVDMALRHGAMHGLCMDVDQAVEAVGDITAGQLADVVYDMTGNAKVFAASQQMLRVLGRQVLIGDTGFPSGQNISEAVITRSLIVLGCMGPQAPVEASPWHYWSRGNMVDLFLRYLADGRMCVSDLNTHAFSPADAQAAYQKLLRDRVSTMGVHFDWSKV